MFYRLKILILSPGFLYHMIISYLPGSLGYFLRYRYWKKRLRYLGGNVKIEPGVYFQNPDYISIGDNCWIDRNVIILAGLDKSDREKISRKNRLFQGEHGVVHVGKNVHLGPGCILSGISAGIYISDDCGFSAHCKIYAFSHHYRSKLDPKNDNIHFGPRVSHNRQCLIEGPIFFGKNTGVALNVVVLPGVAVPENCFVMINSVIVGGRFRPNSIIAGNPAKTIANRFNQDE